MRLSTPDDWRVRGLVGAFWEDFDIKDDMNFLYKTIPSCTPANLAALRGGSPGCVANVMPAPGYAAVDPNERNDNVAFGEDLQRGYKQTAFFTSVDFDMIPKVLTLTGGTRYYHYKETSNGLAVLHRAPDARVSRTASAWAVNSQDSDHDATYSGFKSRGNLTWHITPDAMVYYTFSQGFRPGACNRKNSAEVKIDVDPVTGMPTVGPDANPNLVKQYNKPFTYPPDTLVNNEIGWKTEWLDHRLQVNGSAYIMDWKNVQTLIYNPPGLWEHDLRRGGSRLPDQGRRAADRRARHRRPHAAGFDFAQQRFRDQLALHQVDEQGSGQPDAARHLHHAGLVAGAERKCAFAKPARVRRRDAGLLADDGVQPARALRLDCQRLQDVLHGRRAARRRHAERAEQLPVRRRSDRADNDLAAIRSAGLHDV